MTHIQAKQSGFGLVEVIVSLTIMTMVVIGLNALAQTAYYNFESAKNKSIAYALVQQKNEELRNLRDQNVFRGDAWNKGIDKKILSGGVVVDVIAINTDAEKITTTVTWKDRRGDQKLQSETILTNWK